ncbi:MAG TPA: GTP-binding protein, partial [Myxococcota bacterium]
MTRRIPLSRIRNFGIVAHVDAGKTTLTERILVATGAIHRSGEVHHGTTTTDSHAIERKKGITISSAAVTCLWREHELHLIDTPGHVDFAVEVERSLRVLDGAVVVLDAVAGVEPQTESVWRRANQRSLPRIVFVNKLDRAGADFGRCVDDVRARLAAKPAVIALPWVDGDVLMGTIDVVRRRALRNKDGTVGTAIEPLPASLAASVESARAALVELLAESDERVLAAVVD